jgi:hypothetical protein
MPKNKDTVAPKGSATRSNQATQNEDLTSGRDILSDYESITPQASESDISEEELQQLDQITDEDDLNRVDLDNTDDDGEPLNEAVDLTGEDLDIPGAEEDDANEDIGEEDEENNAYSLSDNK